MKTFQFILSISILLTTISCELNQELKPLDSSADPGSIINRTPPLEFPPAGSNFSRAFDINNAGVIAGTVRNEDGVVVAFTNGPSGAWYSEEELSPNGLPEVKQSINDRGDVAGHVNIPGMPGKVLPALWKNNEFFELDILPGFECGLVFDINASGQMVGECYNGTFTIFTATRATVFTQEGPIDLGALGGSRGAALGINDQGQIVGVAQTASGENHAFLYEDGVMQDLGTLGGTTSNANAINNNGEIVGRAFMANGAIRAFYYNDGVMTNLGTLGGASSVAHDINERGEIVGFSRVPSGEAHAFYYKDGIMHDLGVPMGGLESRALSINNRGDIAGHYTRADGTVRAFVYSDGVMIAY